MTPSALIRNMAALIEEVVDAKYDRASGDQQPVTAQEWDILNERWHMLYVMNKPRIEDELHKKAT